MKSLVGLTMTLLLLGGCTQTQKDKTQQSINNPSPQTELNKTNVSDQTKTDQGKKIGTEYGGKGAGYGQVKKIEPGQAAPPLIEAPQITVQSLSGDWVSTGTTQYHTTTIKMGPTGNNTFNISFYAWQQNAFGSFQDRYMSGNGVITNNKVTFEITEPNYNDLKGEIILQNEKLTVNFIGDITPYQGSYVGFEKEFVRKK
jgi:hypothetical protein